MSAEMDRKTRVALAGFGAWGQLHAQALADLPEAEIAGVFCHGAASRRAADEKLPGTPQFDDYAAMLRSCDADVVSITVPNSHHARFAVAALESGRDVFLEKPLGISLAECGQVIEAERRTGRLVALNHELRVSHQWGAIRRIVEEGAIGRLRYQNFSLFRHKFRLGSGGWRYDPRSVGSWTLEELVHFFDLVLWYARESGVPAEITARANTRNPDGLYENFTAELAWADGSYAILTQCLSGFEHHSLLEIAGTDGAIRTWWSGAMDRTLTPSFELKLRTAGAEHVETISVPFSGEIFELKENMRRALQGFRERRTILGPEEARISVAVCLAADQSVRSGQPVVIAA